MSYLILCLIIALAALAYMLYSKYVLPYAMNKVRDDFSKIQLSKNREIANLQQFLQNTSDRITVLQETVELIDSETLQQSTVAEVSEINNQINSIVKSLQLVQATLSRRAQAGTKGAVRNLFTMGGNKPTPITQAAETAGFYGKNGVNTFLNAVANKIPDVNTADKFLALSEDRREAIIRKVKTNNLPDGQ
jgi:hypothetical protein